MPNKVRFRGTTSECFSAFLRDIVQKRNETDGLFNVRKRIENLLEVDESTMRRWFRGSRDDKFELQKVSPKLKLFLELAGYHQLERERSGSEVRELFSNVALGLVSTSELVRQFNLNESTVYRMINGDSPLSPDKLSIMEEINARLRSRNHELMSHWKKEIAVIMDDAELEGSKPSPQHKQDTQNSAENSEARSAVVLTLVDIVSAVHRLASQVVTEQYTPAERRFLRSLCERSGHSIADCSIVLNALCGERATESYCDELKQKEKENGHGK